MLVEDIDVLTNDFFVVLKLSQVVHCLAKEVRFFETMGMLFSFSQKLEVCLEDLRAFNARSKNFQHSA